MYTPGDILRIHGENDEDWFGEIVDVEDLQLYVHLLERTRDQGGRIWRFNDDCIVIHPISIREHVKVSPVTRQTVQTAWKQLGFVVDVHNFALEEDFNAGRVYLDLDKMDDDDGNLEDDDYDYEDGFVVPDDVANEPFTFADPSTLDAEAAAWVNATHDAVRKYNHWSPEDRSGMGIKRFVDNLATKASNQANNARWGNRMRQIDCKKPPITT